MVAKTGVVDLGSHGGKFTWFQKSNITGGVFRLKRARLDKALASIDWRMLHPNAITQVLSSATSDHRPILLDMDGGVNCRRTQFKYELMWGHDPKCFWVVKNAWKDRLHHNPMLNFYCKLKKTRDQLSIWNKVHFKMLGHQLGDSSGEFSIRSTCRIVNGGGSVIQAEHRWKRIWKSTLHPRLKLLWWQLERDAFQTRGKLAGFMEITNDSCPVCGEEKETIFHLLWQCTIAKAIWFNSPLGIRVDRVSVWDWKQWQEWFLDDCNRPPNISFEDILIVALCVVEAVWRERNSIVHGQTRSQISQLISRVNCKIQEHKYVASNDIEDFCAWSPPPASWLCCNCDIASDGDCLIAATIV
ncbi:hypothetical protein F8388_012519 [Cannabis sativa]|uniref:Reverse transcriptase zinc-binding domain-containing protein n=1 Tax=Cannabis sativa TaxID=3483 RepID=A0A7J6GZZ6_CANSA|nr:hypothetical protein F8388_012519 [Cannabis sativa]